MLVGDSLESDLSGALAVEGHMVDTAAVQGITAPLCPGSSGPEHEKLPQISY